MQQENQPDKLAALQERVASHPDSFADLCALADAYTDRSNWDDAIRTYTQALILAPANSDLQNSLGTVYEEVGNLAEAEKAYRQAIASRPNNSLAYSNLGAFYEEQHRLPEAVQAYEKCLQYSTDDEERFTAKQKLTQLFPERSDVLKMYQGIRAWAVVSLLLGGLSIFAGGALDPIWGIILIVVAALAWKIKIPAMFVIFSVMLGWAAVLNGVSMLLGAGIWWLAFAVVQIILMLSLLRQFRRYGRLRLPELFQAGAWPAQLAAPQNEVVVSDRFAVVGVVLAGVSLILLPGAFVGSVALAIAHAPLPPQITGRLLSGSVDVAVLALGLSCAALLSKTNKKNLAVGGAVVSALVLIGWLSLVLIGHLLK